MQCLSTPGSILIHGPDTVEGFESFSIDAVISEVKQCSPDLLSLFNRLGDVRQNVPDDCDDLAAEEIKAFIALCTLLNAKSRKVKGMQLFMGMMLTARATSRQVFIIEISTMLKLIPTKSAYAQFAINT